MNSAPIREKIQSRLVNGEIEEALNLLISGLDGNQQRRNHDNALMLKAKWENIKQEHLRGTLLRQEYEVNVNRIIAGIQAITNELDYVEKSKSEATNRGKAPQIWYFLLAVICVVGLAVWYISADKPALNEHAPMSTISKVEESGVKSPDNHTTNKTVESIGAKIESNGSNKNIDTQPTSDPVTTNPSIDKPKYPLTNVESPTETRNIAIILNDDGSRLKIDGKPISGSGQFSVSLTLGEHEFEIIETSRSQKCIQKHSIDKTTTKLILTCN